MGRYSAQINRLEKSISLDQALVCKDILEELDQVEAKDREVKEYYKRNSEKLDKVREDIQLLTELLDELNTDNGWTKCLEKKNGTMVFYKKEEDSPFLMTKLATLFPCPVEELPKTFIRMVSLFNETDLMPKWFPNGMMKSHETLVSPTPFTKVTQVKLVLPFPLNQVFGPRDCIIKGKGYDLSERKAAAISVSPLPAGKEVFGLEVPKPPKGFIRFTLKGAYYFEMTQRGILFKQMQLIDLNSKMIPTQVMNLIAKGELPLRQLSRITKKLAEYDGSLWEARVEADERLYDDVAERLSIAVKREFGVEAIPLNEPGKEPNEVSKSKKKRFSASVKKINRISNLRRKKGKRQEFPEDAEEEKDDKHVSISGAHKLDIEEELEAEEEGKALKTEVIEVVLQGTLRAQEKVNMVFDKFTESLQKQIDS